MSVPARPIFQCSSLALAAWGFVLLGCGPAGQQNPAGWKVLPAGTLTDRQKEQQQQALAARDALVEALLSRLQQAMSEHGVGGAVRVCQEEAPRIAATIGQERGLAIGRTSFKLRNPKNRPPDWAATFVTARTPEPTVLAHHDGRLAALLPIRIKPQCLMCHGKEENIPDEVKAAIQERYPTDAAIGFTEGDLRGWFWVEVPAR